MPQNAPAENARTPAAGGFYSQRASRLLTLALCVVYFAGYLARLDYATVIAEIVVREGLAKSQAALATTACFVTYGIGQLCSGWLGDHVSPRWLIFAGLAASAGCNLLLPLCRGVGGMTAVWAANGLAQAMLWPPMMRIMAACLSPVWVERCCVRTSMAASAATILLYLAAPAILPHMGWRGVFYLAAGVAAAVGCGWLAVMGLLQRRGGALGAAAAGAPAGAAVPLPRLLWQGLLWVMAAIVVQGTLRDGVTTWLPSYLVEVFRLDTGASILSGVAIPLFSIVSFQVCVVLARRVFASNEISCSTALFGAGVVLAGALGALFRTGAGLSVVLAALLTGCMHGVNLMLICNLPARFAHTGRVSLIAGVLNACTYVGSALSTWGFALLAQRLGWRATVVCWAALCALGAAACLLAKRRTQSLYTGGRPQ